MALGDSGPSPYAPAHAVTKLIGHARDKGLSGVVTADTLARIGVEPSLAARTISSLKHLDLLNEDGTPSPTLEKLRVAPTAELQELAADWLRSAYKPIFTYVEPTDDVQRIIDQFRHYEPAGQRNRMVTLFLGLCAWAGLIPEVPAIPRSGQKTSSKAQSHATPRRAAEAAATPRPEATSAATPASERGLGTPAICGHAAGQGRRTGRAVRGAFRPY